MKAEFICARRAVILLLAILSVINASPQIDTEWLPITDAERDLKEPQVEMSAGAEILFWRVHVKDEIINRQELRRIVYNYVRLKVFDELGKQKVGVIDIPFADGTSVLFVSARTVRADGSEVKFQKDAIHERDLGQIRGSQLHAKSFTMPGVEPGAIIEYRWQESYTTSLRKLSRSTGEPETQSARTVVEDPRVAYMRFQFQSVLPAERITYFVWPLYRANTAYRIGLWPVNCQPSPLKLENDGYQSTSIENVPAFRKEPMMPGEADVRYWALFFYNSEQKRDPRKYWEETGKDAYWDLAPALTSNAQLKQTVASAVSNTATPEERVEALIRYMHRHVRNLSDPQVSDMERARILKLMPRDRERTSIEVFKSGIGTSSELNMLLASMAASVGLEARPALIADRADITFQPAMADRYFLNSTDVAVRTGSSWKVFDASERLRQWNMLPWRAEGMQALVTDPKKPQFISVPASQPEVSVVLRTAKFVLAESGDIEGVVDVQYSGHLAFDQRVQMQGQTEEGRRERLKDEIKRRYAGAQISEMRIENADEPEQPLRLHYRLKLAAYAHRSTDRIDVQPMFFERGAEPIFTTAERRYPVEFPYAWTETDQVSITVPKGFVLEDRSVPGSIDLGKPGSYDIKIFNRSGRELICRRELIFGRDGMLWFPVNAYPTLKMAFDDIHKRDDMTLSLRVNATPEEHGQK